MQIKQRRSSQSARKVLIYSRISDYRHLLEGLVRRLVMEKQQCLVRRPDPGRKQESTRRQDSMRRWKWDQDRVDHDRDQAFKSLLVWSEMICCLLMMKIY